MLMLFFPMAVPLICRYCLLLNTKRLFQYEIYQCRNVINQCFIGGLLCKKYIYIMYIIYYYTGCLEKFKSFHKLISKRIPVQISSHIDCNVFKQVKI